MDILETLQTLQRGQKIRKDGLPIKIAMVLDKLVKDSKIKFDGLYYSRKKFKYENVIL